MHRPFSNYHASLGTSMNSVEHALETPLLALIRPEVAVFAAEGRHRWRESKINVDLLSDLPAVQVQLTVLEQSAEIGDTPRAKQDRERDAIEAAIEAAIRSLPHPYSSAALDRFAFTDDDPQPSGKGVLEERAIRHFPKITTTRWWTKPRQGDGGLSPHDYTVALVSCALCGIADPVAFLAGRGPTPDATTATSGDPPTPAARRLVTIYRWPLVFAGALVVGALIVAVALLGRGRGRADAATADIGRAFAQFPKERRASVETGEEVGGITLKACPVTGACDVPSTKRAPAARLGEQVSFILDISESYQEPIATMSLTASTAIHNGYTDVTVVAEWRPPIATSAIESRTATARVALQPATPAGLPRLDYVPGTTGLYTLVDTPIPEEVRALNLPDGLFAASGLTLEQVGPRRQRPVVRAADVGNIHFDMRVATAKL